MPQDTDPCFVGEEGEGENTTRIYLAMCRRHCSGAPKREANNKNTEKRRPCKMGVVVRGTLSFVVGIDVGSLDVLFLRFPFPGRLPQLTQP